MSSYTRDVLFRRLETVERQTYNKVGPIRHRTIYKLVCFIMHCNNTQWTTMVTDLISFLSAL